MGSTFQYHLISADGTSDTLAVQAVAIRFRTTASAIFDATRGADDFAGKARTDAEDCASWHPGFGSFLVIPTPPDTLPAGGVEWREVPVALRAGAGTFPALFEALDKVRQLGVSNTKEEREAVFLDWRNREYREAASLRSPSCANGGLISPAQTGPGAEVDCDDADLLPDDRIYLPLTVMLALGFPVAPSPGVQSTAPAAPIATFDLSESDVKALRRRLWAIDCACENLEGLRRRAQMIQADCVKDLHPLLMVRALVWVINDRFTAHGVLHPDQGAARAQLLRDVDALVANATESMLTSPQATVDPKLLPRWSSILSYLAGLLRDKTTIALVDKVLSTRGDLPFDEIASGNDDMRKPVDAVCDSVARAAFWLADGSEDAGTRRLLDAAVAAMGAGNAPSPSAVESLLDYVAALPFVKDGHPAHGRNSPVAACGVMVNAFAGAAIADGMSRGAGSDVAASVKTKVEQAIEKVVLGRVLQTLGLPYKKCDLDTFIDVSRKVLDKAWAQAPTDGDDDVSQAVQAMKTTSLQDGKREARAAFDGAREKLAAFEDAHPTLASVRGAVAQVGASVGLIVALSATPQVPAGDDPGKQPPDLEGWAKVAKPTFAQTRVQVQALEKFGLFAGKISKAVGLWMGRLSALAGIALEGIEMGEAVEKHDFAGAGVHGVGTAGFILLALAPETGGVTAIVGGALVAVAMVLEQNKEGIEDLVSPGSEVLFRKYMAKFQKGSASHFPKLKADAKALVDEVGKGIGGVGPWELLPPLSDKDIEIYGGDLHSAGFAPGEL